MFEGATYEQQGSADRTPHRCWMNERQGGGVANRCENRSTSPSLIRTTCWSCGVIEVPIGQVVLRVDEHEATGSCIIRCPQCTERLSRPACDAMMTALVAVGIEISIAVPDVGRPVSDHVITALELSRFVDGLNNEADLMRLVHIDEPPAASVA